MESADGRLTVEGAGAGGVTIAAVSIDALPAELFLPEDGATIVAVYEIGRAGVSGDLQVHYRASDLRTVQAAPPESGTLTGALPEGPSPGWQTSGDPGLALFTVAVDGEGNSTPSPLGELVVRVDEEGASVRGVLTGAGLGVAQGPEEKPFVVVTGLGESFTISARPSTNREFPIGAVVALRVWLTNNGTQGITDLELSGRSVLLHDVAVTPSPRVKDDVLAPTWSFGVTAASGICTDDRAAGFFWEYTGTAPIAPEGRFANFTRGFEHSELVAIRCVAPRITLSVVFDPTIDTHLYQAVVEPEGSPDFNYETVTFDTVTADEYVPEWSTELLCGERLDGGGPWEVAYYHGAPNGPGGGGCLRVQEENSTIVLTVTQELPLGIGTCTFMYEPGGVGAHGRRGSGGGVDVNGVPRSAGVSGSGVEHPCPATRAWDHSG